ncbi:hypothetical protein PHET_02285 [Paragonimus heterotremus]|uniref:Reverse transcriptase domain-containing protein n=1 Tax=Paragonimus heterotremus TaxID=100268 RepID=A0A8J4WIT5_9TREM|nr:hypothetical protein PHET_02285 [Paragonimus heterotremus]
MLMFSTVLIVLGSTSSIVHGTQLIPVKQCNVTVLHPVLRRLDGITFTCTPSDNVTYFFSICGLRQENASISITSRPAALQRYVSGPTASYEPLAYSESNDGDVQFFEKSMFILVRLLIALSEGHKILKLSSHPDGLCAVLLALRCGRESELLRLIDEKRHPSCIRLFELYHPSLCEHMLPPHVLALILLSILPKALNITRVTFVPKTPLPTSPSDFPHFPPNIDISKAFVNVSHDQLLRTASSYGVTPIILDSSGTCSPLMCLVFDDFFFIPQRGFRQGYPLSPLLCIMCLEEALFESYDSNFVFHSPGGDLDYLVYADDVILFTESREALPIRMERLETKLNAIGLSIDTLKSFSVHIFVDGHCKTTMLDNRSLNGTKRLRDRKLYRAARTKYMRVPNIPADQSTEVATITKAETVCLLANRRISISDDDDSEDQILLNV